MRSDRLKASEERLQILADAGDLLGASLDYHATLQRLSGLLVPRLADWCAVDLLSDAGALERVSVTHVDPTRIALATDLFARFPPRPPIGMVPGASSKPGRPEWMTEISDELLEQMSYDADHLATLRGFASNRSSAYRSWPVAARSAC